jgi:hypothetical protein
MSIVEVPAQFDLAIDLSDPPDGGFTVGAVLGVNPGMAKGHAYMLEGPTLAVGIHPHRHGGAGTEACQQQIIGSRSRIVADRTWLVGGQPVLSGDDLLRVGAGARLRDDHGALGGRVGGHRAS